MNIVMITNTYKPHIGGVARSVAFFSEEYRKMGHKVLIITSEFKTTPKNETGVIRIPSIQNFNGSDFSVVLPIHSSLISELDIFSPDIIHSHHPFLLGDTAVRLSSHYHIPLIFTHHTMYEQYTHYVPADSDQLKEFVIELATGYANMCDLVIAPSNSVANKLRKRGVKTPIKNIPTGVYLKKFANADGNSLRSKLTIPPDAKVIGYLGRLAKEKNLEFLSNAVASYINSRADYHFLVIGDGHSKTVIKNIFRSYNLENRLHFTGCLSGQDLIDGYHAMDVFAFASKSETQGMVLIEALAAGLPIVALDASGVREVVNDKINGRLVANEDIVEFTDALNWVFTLTRDNRKILLASVKQTAAQFSMRSCANQTLIAYEKLLNQKVPDIDIDDSPWSNLLEKIETEWEIISNISGAAINALTEPFEMFDSDENDNM